MTRLVKLVPEKIHKNLTARLKLIKSRLHIPWWGRMCAKLVLSRLPFRYSFWRKVGFFRHGKMDQSAYVLEVFNSHCERSGLAGNLSGRVILELGPGDSIATALIAASYGAYAVLVDSGEYASRDLGFYRSLALDLQALGLNPPDISNAKCLEDVLRNCGATYLTEGVSSLRIIAGDSIDFIFSQAVLEHVRESEFSQTMSECKRVLKERGKASHRVDFKDHLGGGLNNLRFGRNVWESPFFSASGFYTNRLRCSQMLSLIREAGFSIEVFNTWRWNAIPIRRTALAAEFANLSDDDLLIKELDVILR
jgi:SAM-dependent methyltransferase